MANYKEVGVKLTNQQLNKLNFAAKCKTGTIVRIRKTFLFLKRRQKK